MDWDDLRFFHAVAQAGSLSAAARRLDVSQPTVGRRIKDLETQLEAKLFDRLTYGYTLTPTGQRILDKAEEMADAARCIADRVSGEASEPAGLVRITASDGIGALWLAPRLKALRRPYPALVLELSLTTAAVDISGGEADLALRMGDPRDESLVGRRVAVVPFQLYASRCYEAAQGLPTSQDELQGHAVIHSGGRLSSVPQAIALRQNAPDAPIAVTLDNLLAQYAAVRAGIGIAALPSYMAALEPTLCPISPQVFLVEMPVWLLTREDLRHSARVRAVQDFLTCEAKRSLSPAPAGALETHRTAPHLTCERQAAGMGTPLSLVPTR
ncbi:MAG: LysR family transcriptional regulator [Pseudomonadota bacterium]